MFLRFAITVSMLAVMAPGACLIVYLWTGFEFLLPVVRLFFS